MADKKRFKTQVWRWPGDAGWHFVTVPKDLSKEIKKTALAYGSGFIKIEACVGETVWRTALFPHTRESVYLIAIKKSVRKAEGIFENDLISVSFTLI